MRIEQGELILEDGEVPVRPGAFTRVPGDPAPHLMGRQCPDCGDISFPPFRHCLRCGSDRETVEKVLGNEARLLGYTVARQVMPGFHPGYVLAKVRMKDDPTLVLTAQLADVKEEDVAIGMELVMVPRIIKSLMTGEKVVSYCFRPKDPARVTPDTAG
ncbi:MAG: OB-fold domain-containing protein [bacterium]